jgi:uncharacterized protein Yka (UPF0111/DUF47 family)
MEKDKAVAALGQVSLLLPAWIKAALLANERLKLYLSVLQSALAHAEEPEAPSTDWAAELRRLGLMELGWLMEIAPGAYLQNDALVIPHFDLLLNALEADLFTMARPLCDVGGRTNPALMQRREAWIQKLRTIKAEGTLAPGSVAELTHGTPKLGDSLHLLVMDLHKSINELSASIATEDVDGAHVWQIAEEDRPLIQAFMRGLNRTAPLKFNHPGLETAITREGRKLLIQNDIGTNDAHVLVIEVTGKSVRLTYSDLHPPRFEFFRSLIAEAGFEWSVLEPQKTADLNEGRPYIVGYAVCKAKSAQALLDSLEAAASKIVFVIDWNRARKRLQQFVSKPTAMNILHYCAAQEVGHMAWLIAGGERLVYDAMQAVGSDAFRIGDRLDQVIGEAAAQSYLQSLMGEASVKLRQKQPLALVADEARVLLARVMRQYSHEFDLLTEHAAICHAICHILCDALASVDRHSQEFLGELSKQAKGLERRADHLLMTARERAGRIPRWLPLMSLLEQMDDVADTLEESLFLLTLTKAGTWPGLAKPVSATLIELADTTLAAIQDHVKAIEIARHVSDTGDAADQDAFLQALWSTLSAERRCDELHRDVRMQIVKELGDQGALFSLATELAAAMENATDCLLAAGYSLRRIILTPAGAAP